ncbi:MAG: hypothetical protein QMB51_00965, partial [Patescibacteria group bacterium]
DAINCIEPDIVICEYNSVFGNNFETTIPYKEDFYRTNAHHSNLYFGASLPALKKLAKEKGYTFFGCTLAGNDAFFIKNEYLEYFTFELNISKYVYSKARESRDKDGNLTFVSDRERIKLIKDMEVFDLETNKTIKINSIIKKGIAYE